MPLHKTLLLIRHAKSSWDIGIKSDFERTLNERGKKDAPAMAERLLDKKITIDAFVASPATRAKKTATYFCTAYGVPDNEIIFISKLYHATSDDFKDVVSNLNNSQHTVAIFSHNPGITEFINQLVPSIKIADMPTCGIFAVQIHATNWAAFATAKKEFLFFDYPKMS
jgi:phosphohistidine phosphatase